MSCFSRYLPLLAMLSLVGGCNSTSNSQSAKIGPPKIKSLLDVGALPINNIHNLPRQFSDKRFSPGEWVAIEGRYLQDATVALNGRSLDVDQRAPNRLLVKLPRHVNPVDAHKLSVTTPYGSDHSNFHSSHYVIGTDTDGSQHYFMRTHHEAKGFIEKERHTVAQKHAMFNLVSNDGGLMYGIGIKAKRKQGEQYRFDIEIKTLHLAAADKPETIATNTIIMHSAPLSAQLNDQGQMMIVGKNDMVLLDVGSVAKPTRLAQLDLPLNEKLDTSYTDATFFDNGKRIAVLETYSNRLSYVDITPDNQLQFKPGVDVLPKQLWPATVDLVVDPQQANQVWVVTGPNLRMIDDAIVEQYQMWVNNKPKRNEEPVREQLIGYRLQNDKFGKTSTLELPERFMPFYATFGPDEQLYVSGMNLDFFATAESGSTSWLKNIAGMLWDSVAVGRILKLNPKNNATTTAASGLGLYYHLTVAPELGPVFSLLKLKGTVFPPFVTPAWGMGIGSKGTYALRKLAIKTLVPPYAIGQVSFQ